jgi:hypothetical protein
MAEVLKTFLLEPRAFLKQGRGRFVRTKKVK